MNRQIDRNTERQRTDKRTSGFTDRQDRQKYRHTDGQSERHQDGQIERQTYR